MKKIQEDLLELEEPQLLIEGEINKNTYSHVIKSLTYLKTRNCPPLRIIIDSGGGGVAPGLDVYDLIRLYEGQTTGVAVRCSASMAAVILQACDKRLCLRHSEILIHHVSRQEVSLDTLRDTKKRDRLIQDMEKNQARLYDILCKRTGKKVREIARECKKDVFMSSEEALAFGLIDEII